MSTSSTRCIHARSTRFHSGRTTRFSTRPNFLKMPSPRAAYIGVDPAARQTLTNDQRVNFDLPNGATVEAKPGETEPMKVWSINVHHISFGGENMLRRLQALEYIRNNFCMGLPAPPPQPAPAY
jgi:hypothetical protein